MREDDREDDYDAYLKSLYEGTEDDEDENDPPH